MTGEFRSQNLVELDAQLVEEPNSHTSPLHNHVIVRLEHGGHLDAARPGTLAVLGIVLKATSLVILLQRQYPQVDE